MAHTHPQDCDFIQVYAHDDGTAEFTTYLEADQTRPDIPVPLSCSFSRSRDEEETARWIENILSWGFEMTEHGEDPKMPEHTITWYRSERLMSGATRPRPALLKK